MWAERYILVSEGNAGEKLEVRQQAGRDWALQETGRWKRLDVGRNVETDVAIEDDW
jgi:hypothetical protein